MGDYYHDIYLKIHSFHIPIEKYLKFLLELDSLTYYYDFNPDEYKDECIEDLSIGMFTLYPSLILDEDNKKVTDIDIKRFEYGGHHDVMRIGSINIIFEVFAKYGANLEAFAMWEYGNAYYYFRVKDGKVEENEMDSKQLFEVLSTYYTSTSKTVKE